MYQQTFDLNILQYFHNHAIEPRLNIGVHAQNQQKKHYTPSGSVFAAATLDNDGITGSKVWFFFFHLVNGTNVSSCIIYNEDTIDITVIQKNAALN